MSDDDRRNVDIRTDEDEQRDDELDALFEEYKRRKQNENLDADEPLDETLREMQQMSDDQPHPHTDDTDAQPANANANADANADGEDTGPTHVALADEPDPEFDPQDDPDDDVVEQVKASDEKKAQRRKELEADGALDPEDDSADDTGAQPARDEEDGRYGVDISDAGDAAEADARADSGGADAAVPQTEYDPDADAEGDAEDPFDTDAVPDYEDVAAEMALEELDPKEVDAAALEEQDLEDPHVMPGDRVVRVPLDDDKHVDVALGRVSQDAQLNAIDQMQGTESLDERITVVVDAAVAAPRNLVEAQKEWSLGNRMKLFNECQRQLGLDSLADFR